MSGMSQVPRRPLIIGVAGGTASGKNTVCEVIRKQLFAEQRGGDEMLKIEIIHMDSFYKNLTKAEEENIEDYNFDHPDAFDFNTIVSTLTALKAQKKIIIPDYDFKNHRRLDCGNEVSNVDVVLLEGILVLYQKDLRDLLDLMLFVDIDADTRLARRVLRDADKFHRELEAILKQYTRFVKPAFEDYVLPTKKYADVIIPRGADNTVAIDVIVQHIKQHFSKRTSSADQMGLRKGSQASSDGGRRVSSDFRASLH